MTPKISIAATTGLLEAITDAGGNPDQILRQLGLERSVLTNPEGFISASILVRFLEQAAQATADDCLGLHFGERYNPKNIGPLIYVALNSPTIGAGIENVERYLKVPTRRPNGSRPSTVSAPISGMNSLIWGSMRRANTTKPA